MGQPSGFGVTFDGDFDVVWFRRLRCFLGVEFLDAMGGPVVHLEVRGVGGGMFFEDFIVIIALCGGETGVADEAAENGFIEAIGGAGGGDDIFLHHDTSHVVCAEKESDLTDFGTHGDPGGADGVEIIQEKAGDCLGAEIVGGAGHAKHFSGVWGVFSQGELIAGIRFFGRGGWVPFLEAAEGCVFTLEGPGDEGVVAAGPFLGDGDVLSVAEAAHVVDAVEDAFDVSEHHGAGGEHAEAVGGGHDVDPLLSGGFAQADAAAHVGGEDFAAAAGEGVEAGGLEAFKDVIELCLPDFGGEGVAFAWGGGGEAGEVEDGDEFDDFRGREAVDVDVREAGFDAAEHFFVELDGELGVHAALEEDLGAADVGELLDFLVELLGGEGVGVFIAQVTAEGAEGAAGGADVGVVDVAVDDIGAWGAAGSGGR